MRDAQPLKWRWSAKRLICKRVKINDGCSMDEDLIDGALGLVELSRTVRPLAHHLSLIHLPPHLRNSHLSFNKKKKGTDLISDLPIEILVTIVSLLPLDEAVPTSILSRSWKDVWKYTSNLNFDSAHFFKVGTGRLQGRRAPRMGVPYTSSTSSHYVDCVNKVLGLYRGQSIERFRVQFFYESSFAIHVDQWVQIAMEKGVQMLELDICDRSDDDAELYTITKAFGLGKGFDVELLNSGTLEVWRSGFNSLKVLHLRNVCLTTEVLEYLLSKCPVIERLSLISVKKLTNITAVGSSIALKHLVITNCLELISVDIWDTNIISLCYNGHDGIVLNLNNVPYLTEVTIFDWGYPIKRISSDSIMRAFAQLSCCLSNIETLRLDTIGAVCHKNDVFPLLKNLKHLELIIAPQYDISIHLITSFLKASPYLQRLILKLQLQFLSEPNEKWEVQKCPHQNLKVVEMMGYKGCLEVNKHVQYFIENLVSLEKIVIDPRFWYSTKDQKAAKTITHAKRHLGAMIPSTVKLVCL